MSTVTHYSTDGLWSKRRPPKRRQKWLYSKHRQTQTTPTVL